MPIALTVAGFDPSSGAGITADLQTFAAHGLFGTAAITALTVQSTQGVAEVAPIAPSLLSHTLKHLVADLPPAGVKLGMLGSMEVVEVVAAFLRGRDSNPGPVIVLDPVLRSSSGASLFPRERVNALHEILLPLADYLTPNWGELSVLTGLKVHDLETAELAMRVLGERHPQLTIIATGGDQEAPVDLLWLPTGALHTLPGERVETSSTHGTGCAFSAALLAQLVRGTPALGAANAAKRFVEGALRYAPGLGMGRGPMDLLWPLREGNR